ncbi:MAG TPA: T9SS type A sorting domain-containing protein [Bacteroidia bacterium]|nr:T9SS type A sorting domain-containing protein [Bacteroidia bacterium]
MKKLFTLLTALALGSLTSNAQLIYDNGSIVNQPGAGAGGADVSSLHDGLSSFGIGHAVSSGYRVADDFIIPAGQTWTIDSIVFLAYQTGSGNTSTMTEVNCAIYDGAPDVGILVFGDQSTNMMQNTYFSNIYRTTETTFTNTDRPVMRNVIVPPSAWSLSAGTYWLDWQTNGTLTSGPWAPPLTNANTITGNGMQFDATNSVWGPCNDGGTLTQQGFPFEIYGTITTSINNVEAEEILTVMPNPSKGTFRINAAFTGKTNLEINVTDLMGKTVYSNMLNDISVVSKTIELKNAAKGVYVLKLNSDSGKTLTKKIVVE